MRTGHSYQCLSFSTNYFRFVDSTVVTVFHVYFSYWPINLKRHIEDVFGYTVAEATKLGVSVFVTTIYADFVSAMHSVLTAIWPSCEVKARRIHFGQCCWRTVQSLGLSQQYGEEYSEVSLLLKKVFGLMLVPPTEVSGCFAFDFTSSLSNYRRVTI